MPAPVVPSSAKRFSFAIATGALLLSSAPDAQAQPEGATQAPVCARLQKQLRWHEPFFGLRTWPELADEALANAAPACRDAIAAGQAPEVAADLQALAQHIPQGGPPLRRYTYRLACKLRMPEQKPQILAGVREPAVYAECADALFAMEWNDPAAQQLRDQYVEGLRSEPLKTHLPAAALRPPYIARLAPLLRAYDIGQLPRRDTIYLAMCVYDPPTTSETQAACAGLGERETEWATRQLLANDLDSGLAHLAALPPEKLPPLTWLLRKFHTEQRPGRDAVYQVMCKRNPAPDSPLTTACRELLPAQEPLWAARHRVQQVMAEAEADRRSTRRVAGGFLVASLLLAAHAVFAAYKRKRTLAPPPPI
jgi:hypothetical protein